MRKNVTRILCVITVISLISNRGYSENGRKIIDFNADWLFEQDDWIGLNNASQFRWNDAAWIHVQTPHTYNADDTFDPVQGYYRGFVWYRKHFRVPVTEKGRIVKINFGAIGNVSEIWVNEKYYGKTTIGYVPVEIDITDDINWNGDNLIAVRVQNLHDDEIPPGRWRMDYNVYGGIYREVSLISLPAIYFIKDDFIVTTPVVEEKVSQIKVRATVFNQNITNEPVEISCRIMDGDKLVSNFSQKTIIPSGLAIVLSDLAANVPNAKLWSPESPYLYKLEAYLFQAGEKIDAISFKVGFRTSRFDPEKGYILNNKPIKLRGLNRHQCYPGLGNAVPVRLQIEDAAIMKDLGANFVRCSHYPQHESFLNACDSLGLLVYEEVASWQHIGGDEFIENMDDMLKAMIRRDRNHPSIILWGMMNEGRSEKMFENLKITAHTSDPTRPACYAENHIDVGIKEGTLFIPDVAGLNYILDQYDQLHMDYPQLKLINLECSNGDNSIIGNLESQLKSSDKIKADLDYMDTRSWLAGSCIWCFHDYGTEYKPVWPIQTSGVVDVYRRYKEAAWMLKARWSKDPFLRIAGHWFWPGDEGKEREIRVWNNCEVVHLYLNGKEIPESGKNIWKAAYQPGELKAIGTREKTKIEYVLHTPGKAVALKFKSSDINLKNDGNDAKPVTVEIVDESGNPVPLNGKTVSFHISGPGKLVGIGKNYNVTTADGDATILVQSTGGTVEITVTAQSENLQTGELHITVDKM